MGILNIIFLIMVPFIIWVFFSFVAFIMSAILRWNKKGFWALQIIFTIMAWAFTIDIINAILK